VRCDFDLSLGKVLKASTQQNPHTHIHTHTYTRARVIYSFLLSTHGLFYSKIYDYLIFIYFFILVVIETKFFLFVSSSILVMTDKYMLEKDTMF